MSALASQLESSVVRSSGSPVQSLAFTADMRLMASGDTRRVVRVWYRGDLIHEINLSSKQDKVRPTERIRGLAFSPAGDTLYTACGDTLRAISMTTGETRWLHRPPRSFGFLIVSPICLAVSSMGEIAMATDAGRISLWTAEGGMRSQWWDNDSPRQIAFLGDDRIVGTDSFSVCVWRMDMSRKLSRKRLPERVYGFAAAPKVGRICLRTIHDVEVWDMTSDVLVARYPVPYGAPLVSISPDGETLFLGGTSEILMAKVGDDSTKTIEIRGAAVRSLAVQPDGAAVVAGCSDGSLRTWDLR